MTGFNDVIDGAAAQAERYGAVFQAIGNDFARFGEIGADDLAFATEFAHNSLLRLTAAMLALGTTDAEREAAILRTMALDVATLERQAELATVRMQRGLPQTLRDLSAMWCTQAAIHSQLEFERERRAAPMN
ncbi:MAG: hypothetical protein AB7O98_17475 [Hyphomonadaceae bacterium]